MDDQIRDRVFDIVGIGYCGLDHVCLVPHIPKDEKVEILEHLIQGGGPAATAIVAAQRLGSRCAFIGAVGADGEGAQIAKAFLDEGVDTAALVVQPGRRSPLAYCWTEKEGGRRSIAWTRGSIQPLAAGDLNRYAPYLSKVRALHCDGHQLGAALEAAAIVKSGGGLVSLDAGSILPGIEKLMALADILIASESFARRFTGVASIEVAARRLRDLGPAIVGVTSGEAGAYALSPEGEHRQAAFAVDVVDTTGAGDTFHGAFVHAYLAKRDVGHALSYAAATAALKCTALGGRTGLPRAAAVQSFLERQMERKPR
jgi:sugar/nucleoside kinase (ribokinase family)